MRLRADVDLATSHLCFSKDHLLFHPRNKGHTIQQHPKRAIHQTDDLLWILNPPFLYHDYSWLFLLQLEVWKFSEIIGAKFIDCFYEPVHTCSQGMLCITCSPEVEMWQFKSTVNMEWLCPEGTMNLERELPCQKPRVTSGCKGFEIQEIRKFLKTRRINYVRCKKYAEWELFRDHYL